MPARRVRADRGLEAKLARADRPASRIRTDLPRRNLFQSPQQSTPLGFNIPSQPTPPSRPDRFHTSPNHYNNPTTNVMAATQLLTTAPIYGDTPTDQVARQAAKLLKTTMTQQANYSRGHSHLHETPYQSVSRQAESSGPAASGSHRQHEAPQRTVGVAGQPTYQPSHSENIESVGRSTVNRWLVPALRNASLPADFKAPRKLANYTADMDPTVWME